MDFDLSTAINMVKDNKAVELRVPTDAKLASNMQKRIVTSINDFEKNMPEHLITGGRMVSFHDTTFSIEDVGYRNPDVIIFFGKLSDGSEVQLIQHTSQLNLFLQAVPRLDIASPRRIVKEL